MNETDWVIPASAKLPFVGMFWRSLLGYNMPMNGAVLLAKVSRSVIDTMIVENPIAPNDARIVPNGPVFNRQEVVL